MRTVGVGAKTGSDKSVKELEADNKMLKEANISARKRIGELETMLDESRKESTELQAMLDESQKESAELKAQLGEGKKEKGGKDKNAEK